MAETGKPGTNWKQVTPANRKKVSPLVKHWMSKPHPFTACVRELAPEKGEESAKRICAVVKDMGMRSTKWRKGGGKKVTQAPEEVDWAALTEECFDEVIAPVLEAEGVTIDDLAMWSERAVAAGVLADVDIDVDGDFSPVLEAARGAVMARGHRRPGESLAAFGNRMKAADKAKADAAKAKTRTGKTKTSTSSSSFESQHPRGRGGAWTIKAGQHEVSVKSGPKGNLHAATSQSADKIRAFQKAHGLQVDGVIGKQTASALLGNKSASKVAVGAIHADQRDRLLPKKTTMSKRVRQAPQTGGLGDVTFRPSELVEAACKVSAS